MVQGPRGATGVAGAAGAAGAAGQIGETGPIGPGGADGADGLIGEIAGIAATTADLPTTGIDPGTIYYVEADDGVYVWDGTAWTMVDVAQGPRGATGPTGSTGPSGEDGIVGQIQGVVATVADLPTTGIDPGALYYVEADDGVYIWDGAAWKMVNVAQGPRGATGPAGPTGPVGTILGSYNSLADLQRAHPRGNQGDMYLVDGVLYIWDVDSSSWRAVGDLRPVTEAATIIPFASQVAPHTSVNGGVPTRVTLIGFGYGDRRDDDLLFADPYSFLLNTDNSFVLEGDNDNLQVVFSLPFDMTIKSIALTTGNWAQYDPIGTVYPQIQLYAAAPTSNNFAAIDGAVAIPERGHGPGTVPANTMLYALKENIDVKLSAGTRIAIGALARIDGDTGAENYYLYFTGGIGMTRSVE